MNPKDKVGLTKPQLWLIPPQTLIGVSKVFQSGAKKYGAFNWRDEAIQISQYISALYRHVGKFQEGEDLDDESGLSHLDHALATLLILRDAMLNDKLIDDRPPKIKDFNVYK